MRRSTDRRNPGKPRQVRDFRLFTDVILALDLEMIGNSHPACSLPRTGREGGHITSGDSERGSGSQIGEDSSLNQQRDEVPDRPPVKFLSPDLDTVHDLGLLTFR